MMLVLSNMRHYPLDTCQHYQILKEPQLRQEDRSSATIALYDGGA